MAVILITLEDLSFILVSFIDLYQKSNIQNIFIARYFNFKFVYKFVKNDITTLEIALLMKRENASGRKFEQHFLSAHN